MRYLVCGDLCNCLNRISVVVADGIDCAVVKMELPPRLALSLMAEVTGFFEEVDDRLALTFH